MKIIEIISKLEQEVSELQQDLNAKKRELSTLVNVKVDYRDLYRVLYRHGLSDNAIEDVVSECTVKTIAKRPINRLDLSRLDDETRDKILYLYNQI